MNKYIIAFIVIVIAGIVYAYHASTVEYVRDIDADITQLEEDLSEIDASLADGSLSGDKADEAYNKVQSRVDSIKATLTNAGNGQLTEAEKQRLASALTRLKEVLVNYQATLVTLETVAPKKKRSGGGGGKRNIPLTESIAEAIVELEEHTEEVLTEEEFTELVEEEEPESFDEVVEEIEEQAAEEEEMSSEEIESTDESITEDETVEEEVATTTEDTTSEEDTELTE